MKQAHLFVSGFVQGIGFRAFIKHNAEQLGITGWVRNLPDGRVEAVLQGDKEKIKKLIELCNKGPFLAEVEELVVEWEGKGSEYSDFKVLR